jgi:prolipoprotein diacylglyceryl transferase
MINLFVHWNVDPEIVQLGGIPVRYYGILFVGGIVLALFMLEKMAKSQGFTSKEWDRLTLYGLLGIVLGARLGHCLFYEPGYFLAHPVEIFLPIQKLPDGSYHFTGYQGLASHGGAIGLILALALFTWQTKRNIWITLDLVAVVTPISAFFIRMANLMNSEIFGKPTDLPWGFEFVRSHEWVTKCHSLPCHPTQIYEGLSYLLIFFLNLFLYRKMKDKVGSGFFFGLTITLIFVARFFIEFLKLRQVDFEESMAIDMGQWLSVPFVIVGIYLVYRSMKKA